MWEVNVGCVFKNSLVIGSFFIYACDSPQAIGFFVNIILDSTEPIEEEDKIQNLNKVNEKRDRKKN